MNMKNHKAACEFADNIKDPIVRNLLTYAYQMLFLTDAKTDSDFDVLYYFQIMELFLRDREKLCKWLQGDYPEDTIFGDD